MLVANALIESIQHSPPEPAASAAYQTIRLRTRRTVHGSAHMRRVAGLSPGAPVIDRVRGHRGR